MTTVLEPETTTAPEWRNPTLPEVERGAAWLDENVPGWANLIDTEDFDIGECERCIAGQLLATCSLGAVTSHCLGRYPESLGMDLHTFGMKDDERDRVWHELQVAWEYEIARRRELA